MKQIVLAILFCALSITAACAIDVTQAERCQREAEYYQRQAESYQRDAESYLRKAKSLENDAAYYMRNKQYDRACDYFKRAASAMDSYESKLGQAKSAADRAEDYLKRAASALR